MHISFTPEVLFHIGSLAVTNTMLTTLITSILLIAGMLTAARRLTINPLGGFAGLVEVTCEIIAGEAEQTFGSRELALKYFPLLGTLFIFILTNNLLELLPGFNTLELNGSPVLRAVTTDLNTTVALALISVVLTQIYAIQRLGVMGNLRRYISTSPLMTGVGLLEGFLELTRIISFSFRLFGNIFAGDVLLIVIAALLPILGPSPFWGLELFVGFIQAYVFTMLTMVFIAIAITPEAHTA